MTLVSRKATRKLLKKAYTLVKTGTVSCACIGPRAACLEFEVTDILKIWLEVLMENGNPTGTTTVKVAENFPSSTSGGRSLEWAECKLDAKLSKKVLNILTTINTNHMKKTTKRIEQEEKKNNKKINRIEKFIFLEAIN